MSQVVEAFTMEELDLEHGELLPARETMAHVNVLAINAAIAANIHSPHAVAAAVALQKVVVH